MTERFDCIVLGVGGFGSAALYHLARRKLKVLGIERFGIAHDRGSSHGETRIIRKAYIEHPDYVPLVLEAYNLWAALQQEAGRRLLQPSGMLLSGRPDGEAIPGALLAARQHDLSIEAVDPKDLHDRFPGFQIPDGHSVLFDADAGYLFVEECVRAHVEQAVAYGGILKTDETTADWTSHGHRVRVRTDRGEYEAASLIITAGPWARDVLRDLSLPLEVVRKPSFWHEAKTRAYDAASGCPVYYFELPTGDFYGFPCLDGQTVKVAQHSGGTAVAIPIDVDRQIHAEDRRPVADFLKQCMPGIRLEAVRHSVCMYTLTPDRHFIVDKHPAHENVVIGAGFSGHGFKFTPVLGKALAELAVDGQTESPIGFLSINRPALKT